MALPIPLMISCLTISTFCLSSHLYCCFAYLSAGGSLTCMVLTVAEGFQALFFAAKSFCPTGEPKPPGDRIPDLLNVLLSAGRVACYVL